MSRSPELALSQAGREGRPAVYILPTRQGLAFAATLLVMLLGAINYNNSLAHLLTFLLGSVALVAMVHTWANLRGLTLDPGEGEPVFCGDEAIFTLVVDNRGGPVRQALDLTARTPEGERVHLQLPQLDADSLTVVRLRARSRRRGWMELDQLTLSSRFPLGLFRAWHPARFSLRCLVWPAPGPVLRLPPPQAGEHREQGGRRPGPEDFAGLRGYRPGDAARSIAWKALARDDSLRVKRFEGEGLGEIILRYEETPASGGMEGRLSQLCRWVLMAEAEGVRYGLGLPGRSLEPASGVKHRDRCLRELALFGDREG